MVKQAFRIINANDILLYIVPKDVYFHYYFFFFQAEDGIRARTVTGVQTCALPISGLLAPHLTAENAEELLAAAAHRTKAEIELLLARRFPRSELLALVQPLPHHGPPPAEEHAPAQVGADEPPEHVGLLTGELAPAQVGADEPPEYAGLLTGELAPAQVGAPVPRARV